MFWHIICFYIKQKHSFSQIPVWMHEYIFVFVQKYIHRVRSRDRFLDPPPGPPINFVYDQISIYLGLG